MSTRAASSSLPLRRFGVVSTAAIVVIALAALMQSGCGFGQNQAGPHVTTAVVTPIAPSPPPPSAGPAPAPTTGAGVKRSFGLDIHDAVKHWPTEPFQFWRLWDATVDWARVEPSRGVFDFSRLDKYVDLAQQHHVQLVYVLGNTPAWAALDPTAPCNEGIAGASSPPANMQDWRDFVTAIVTRYQGRIQVYEVWNEANLTGYWTGSVTGMVDMVRMAYTTIKQIDPTATVLSPSVTAESGLKWLGNFLNAGGANYSDGIAYHLYSRVQNPEDLIPYYQNVMKMGSVWGKDVWNTEVGWGPWGTMDDTQQASFLARMFILQSAVGFTHIGWYAWDDRGAWVNAYLLQADLKTPTLAGVAFGEIQGWLQDASLSCSSQSDTWQCDVVAANGTHRYIVWNPVVAQSFQLPAEWQVSKVRDLTGATTPISGGQVPIGSLPVLVEP